MKRNASSRLILITSMFTFLFSIVTSKAVTMILKHSFYDSMTVVGLLIVLVGICASMAPKSSGAHNICAMSKQQTFQFNLYSISFLIAGILAILFGIAMR